MVGAFPSNSLKRQCFARIVLQHSTQQSATDSSSYYKAICKSWQTAGVTIYYCSAHEKQAADIEDSNLLAE